MNINEILMTDEQLHYNTNFKLLKLLKEEKIDEEFYFDHVDPYDLECINDGSGSKSNKRKIRRNQKLKAKNKLKLRRKSWFSNEWWKIYNHEKGTRYAFYKKYANRYLRHCNKNFALKGRNYRKTFDYWWKVD